MRIRKFFSFFYLFSLKEKKIYQQIKKCCIYYLFSEKKIQEYLDDFKKEVLDQDLRENIKRETEAVRNLILSHAFSKTGLIQDE